MDSNIKKQWVLVGSTVLGGAGCALGASRLGLALGPLGVAAGAVIGALAGASVASLIVGDVDFAERRKERPRRGLLN